VKTPRANLEARADERVSARNLLSVGGALLLGGFVLNAVVTMAFHPSGDEDDHEAIFTEYADSDGWVATHLGQFLGILLVLAGLLVLSRALRDEEPLLARFAAGATIATAATWAVLQAVDGVALKQAVDAWAASSGAEQSSRFADAETLRSVEWGVQSYFRVLFGLTVLLLGVGLVATRLVAGWLGWTAALAGLLSGAIGVDVGYNGLDSGFQDLAVPAFQVVALIFVVGVLVSGARRRGPVAAPQA
jgi:Domain of unknown function (DUF4386)